MSINKQAHVLALKAKRRAGIWVIVWAALFVANLYNLASRDGDDVAVAVVGTFISTLFLASNAYRFGALAAATGIGTAILRDAEKERGQ